MTTPNEAATDIIIIAHEWADGEANKKLDCWENYYNGFIKGAERMRSRFLFPVKRKRIKLKDLSSFKEIQSQVDGEARGWNDCIKKFKELNGFKE